MGLHLNAKKALYNTFIIYYVSRKSKKDDYKG